MNQSFKQAARVEHHWRQSRKNGKEVSVCRTVAFFSALSLGLYGSALVAAPVGGQVTRGQGEILYNENNTLINQRTNRLDIDWQTFSSRVGENISFKQPNALSTAINRVIGGVPSELRGALNANGRVFIVNNAGITFHGTSQVNVGALLATTARQIDENGDLITLSEATGSVINHGNINVSPGGFAVLAAPFVSNTGLIEANLGRIELAAANSLTVDLRGDGLIHYSLEGGTVQGVNNTGTLRAQSGRIQITGGDAKAVVGGVINLDGVVDANAFRSGEAGTVLVLGDEVNVSASVSASGPSGGSIDLLGTTVNLQWAGIDASGPSGGGSIRIGGDYQGKGTAYRAQTTTVDFKSVVSADATVDGDGGQVIVWSDDTTTVHGKITARGGAQGGDGGFIETSGKRVLNFSQAADASAPHGAPGEWLLDPEDIDIGASEASAISESLNAGNNVSVETGDSGDGNGDIDVNSDIEKTEGDDARLSLKAHGEINVNASITSTSGKLDVSLKAGKEINIGGSIATNGGGVSTTITGVEGPEEEEEPEKEEEEENDESEPKPEGVVDEPEAIVKEETADDESEDDTEDSPEEELELADDSGDETFASSSAVLDDTTDDEEVTEELAELFLDIPAEPEFDIAFTDPLTPSIEISADIVTSGGDIDIQAGSGTAWVNAVLNASNLDDGAIGGSVSVLGDYVNLGSDAVIDVTGDAGGGVVLVGGDFQGGGDTPTAKKTTIAAGAQIRADAVTDGDGGKIIVWADDRTEFSGDISVTGGELGGDGGFVEVSGKKSLKYRGHVDASAPNGEYGDLLLDPQNIFIVNGVGGTGSIAGGNNGGTSNETNYTIYEDTLEAQTANVTLLAGDLIQLNNLSDDLLDMQANLSLLIGGDGSDGGIIRFGTAGAASSTINDVIRVNNDSANITIGARDSAAGPVAIRVGRLEALDVDTGDSQSKASIDIRSNGGDITIYGGMLASANVDSGVKAEAHITVSAATPSTNSTVKDGNVTITGELRAVASDASHTADADITVNNAHDVTLDSAVVLAQVTTTYAGKTADANLVLHAGSDAGRGSSGKLVVNENISVTASNEQYGGVASASADLRAAADIYLNVGDASDKTEAAVEVLAITKSTLNTLNNAANDKADAELYIYAGSHSSGGLTVYGGLVVNAEVDNKNENDTAPVMRADATLRVLAADNITVKTDAFQTANAFEVVAKNVSKGDKSKTAEKANAYLYVQAGLPDHVNASSASGGNLTVIGQTVVKATASGSDFAGDANAQAYLLAYDDVSLTHDGSNTSYLGIEISAKSDFAGDGTSANLGDTKAYLYIHAGEEGASPNTAKSSDGIVTISDDIQVTAVSQKLAGDADADIIIKAADSITVTGEVGAKASVVASANDIAENSDLGNYLYEGSANAFVRIEAGTHNSDGSISIKKITVDADIKQGTNANAYTDPWTANLNARATLKIFGGDDVTIGSSGMFSSNVINVDAFASDSGSNPFSDLDINTFATAVVYAGSHSDGDLTITGQTRTVAETRVHDGAAYEGDAQAYADLRLLAADDVTISGDEAITVYAGMLSAESGRSSDTVDGTADAYLYILAGDPDHVSTADEANSTFYAGDLSVTGKTSVKALVSDHGGGSGFGDKAQARAFFEAGDDVTLSILDGNSDTAIEVIARADVQDIGKSTSADVDAYLYIHAGLESGTKGSDGKISIRGDVDVDAWGFGIAGRADADAYLIAAGDISIEYLGDAKIHVDALSSVASESTLGTANKTRTAVADAYLYVNAGTHTANSSGVVTIEAIEVDAQAITDSLGVLYNGLSRLALDADATLIINAGDDINLGFAYAGTASAGLLETAVSVQASATHDYSVTEHVGQVDLDARIVIDITAGTHSSGDLNIKGKLFADADVTLGSAMISTGGSGKADAEVDVRLSAADDINLTRKIGHDAIEIEAHADIADSNARGTAEAYLYVLAGDPDHIGSDAAEPGDINVVGEIDVRSIAALHENPTDSTGSGFYEPEASSYFGYATRADAEVHLLAGGDITVTDSGRNVRVEAYTLNTGSNASYAGSANAYLYVQAGWQGDSSQNTKGINGSITIGSSG
ncbi:MAG: filamentous hemagglutinin family protein, partial [Parasphingorhabdus sp.]